jgi:hypothetical protein
MTNQTIVHALADWFKKSLAKLPREKRRIAEFHIKNWAKLSPTGRYERAVEVDRQQATKLRIKNDKVRRMLELAEKDPQQGAEEFLGWYDGSLDAETWRRIKSIGPLEAALLLCQLNPHNDTLDDARKTKNDETGPADFNRLLRVFEDVAQADEQPRTLSQWRDIAHNKKLKYHSWVDKYEAAVRLTAKHAKGGNSVDALPKAALSAPNSRHEQTWRPRAQQIAFAFIAKHKEDDLFPSQDNVCNHVAEVLRKEKVYGYQGKPMEASYIKRNAIQGAWWQANKP